MELLPYVLAAANIVAPGRDHTALSGAIARRVDAETALFTDDPEKKRTSALLIAIAFRESSLRPEIEGDHDAKGTPTSFCAFQVHLVGRARTADGWTGADLVKNVDHCVAAAFRLIRDSIKECARLPAEERLAWYARGRCDSKDGQRLSRDRTWLARHIGAKLDAAAKKSGALFSLPPTATRFCANALRSDALPVRRRCA